jgi:hypothetical protein
VLIPLLHYDQFGKLPETLVKDKQFEASGSEYLNAPFNRFTYARLESILLYAFSGMPQLEVPKHATSVNERYLRIEKL